MSIDEHYINRLLLRLEQREARPRPPNNVVYVTELASPCARKVWYSRRYEPEATEHEAIKWLGKALHEILEEGLRSDGWEVEIPVAIHDTDITIRGRVDAARLDYATDRYTDVLEIKTVDTLPNHPRPEHIHQAAIYAAILEAQRYHIVYISRRDGRPKVFSNEAPDPKATINAAKEVARRLAKTLQSDTPPDPVRGPPPRKFIVEWIPRCEERARG